MPPAAPPARARSRWRPTWRRSPRARRPIPPSPRSLRDGIRASLAAAQADGVIEPSLEVVLDEGARALDPVQLVTLLRDGTDACQPLTWQKPSGPDSIAAQLALRTFVAAACELKTPAAPLASAISGRRSAGRRRQGRGVDEAARRAGDPSRPRDRRRRAAEGRRAAVDRRRRPQGAVARGARRPPAARRSGRRRPVQPAGLAAHRRGQRDGGAAGAVRRRRAPPASPGCRCSSSPRS